MTESNSNSNSNSNQYESNYQVRTCKCGHARDLHTPNYRMMLYPVFRIQWYYECKYIDAQCECTGFNYDYSRK